MFSKFNSLETEKQERIINAAMKEFAQKGFKNASTNEIVKEAGIAKGMLFHYFNNKKDLFLFLYDYSIDMFINEFFRKIDLKEKDILERLRHMALLKIELINKHPEMFNFILTSNFENSSEIKDDLEGKNRDIYAKSYSKLFDDIDVSKFKKGIDIKRAVNIIIWTIEGLRNQEQEKARLLPSKQINYDSATREMDAYLEQFRNCFYK